jgi:inorganic pyrophosphatase
MDVLVLCTEDLEPLSMVRCYPIGVVRMIDDGEIDDKIIAIPFKDPTWNYYHELEELPPHITEEVEHFFKVYKNLEHKDTTGFEVYGRKKAEEIIEGAIKDYQDKFQVDLSK